MALVKFYSVSQQEYDGLDSVNNGALYFTNDTHRIYRGTEFYSNNLVILGEDDEFPTSGVEGLVYVKPDSYEIKIWDETNDEWVSIGDYLPLSGGTVTGDINREVETSIVTITNPKFSDTILTMDGDIWDNLWRGSDISPVKMTLNGVEQTWSSTDASSQENIITWTSNDISGDEIIVMYDNGSSKKWLIGGWKINEHQDPGMGNWSISKSSSTVNVPYIYGTASTDHVGGVKVGSNLTVDADGTLNAEVPKHPAYIIRCKLSIDSNVASFPIDISGYDIEVYDSEGNELPDITIADLKEKVLDGDNVEVACDYGVAFARDEGACIFMAEPNDLGSGSGLYFSFVFSANIFNGERLYLATIYFNDDENGISANFGKIYQLVQNTEIIDPPSKSESNPLMDGIASAGTSTEYAAADHIHPTDTSRAAATDLQNYLPLSGGTLTGNLNINAILSVNGAVTIGTRHPDGSNIGDYSFANGNYVVASNAYSHAEGSGTYANGNYSHAEGNGTTANGDYSHAEGDQTETIGDWSHAEGTGTHANGDCSHAEGTGTFAIGNYSHAEGNETTAEGESSHAEGYASHTLSDDRHAYAWNGDEENYGPDNKYESHGAGTFNINPVGGTSGFYIGEQNLSQILNSFGTRVTIRTWED